MRWGQIVENGGVQRPGLNTIYDTLRVTTGADGRTVVDRIMVWRDINSAWRSFRTTTAADMRPIQTVTRTDAGDLRVARWDSTGAIRRAGHDAASGLARFGTQREATPESGFAGGLYGMEFRAVPETHHSGRVLIDRGAPEGPESVRYTASEVLEIPNLAGLAGPFRVFRTGEPGSRVTEYWLTDEPPYVARVRFEQADGTVTTWVITSFEMLEGDPDSG